MERTISYAYDAAGQLTSASDPDSSYGITYDHLGRVTQVDNNGTSGVPRVILDSVYDAAGNRASLAATVAGTADFLNEYTHDALHRLTRVDQVGQTGGNSVAEKRVDLAYNAINEFTSIARYQDTDGGSTHEVATSAYSYDDLGRLTDLAYTKGGNNLFTAYSWSYDDLSSAGMGADGVADPRVAATAVLVVPAGLGRVTEMTSQDGTSTYSYDAKSELTAATHTFQSNESYSYDNNGNRTMTGYQTGDDNQLTNDGTYSYTYDEEGNRLTRTKTATGEVTEYAWDFRNRLTKVTDKNSQGTTTQVVEYTYDVFDRRIGKAVDTASPFDMADAAIERYVYDDIQNGLASPDGGNVVLDFVDGDGSGQQSIALSKRYLYGEVVDQILAQEDVTKNLSATDRVLWPLADNLGTVRDLAKQDGTIAVHYMYDSYGNVTSGDTSKTRYLFTGREFDTDTNLQYNRARWLDPEVGRRISEDSAEFAAGDTNVARYVGNDVIGLRDTSGFGERPGLVTGADIRRGLMDDVGLRPILQIQDDHYRRGRRIAESGQRTFADLGGFAPAIDFSEAIGGKNVLTTEGETLTTGQRIGSGFWGVIGIAPALIHFLGDVVESVRSGGKRLGYVGDVIEDAPRTPVDDFVLGENPERNWYHGPDVDFDPPAFFVGGTLVCVPGPTAGDAIVVTAAAEGSDHNWLMSSVLVLAALSIQVQQVTQRKRKKNVQSEANRSLAWGHPTQEDGSKSNQLISASEAADAPQTMEIHESRHRCIIEDGEWQPDDGQPRGNVEWSTLPSIENGQVSDRVKSRHAAVQPLPQRETSIALTHRWLSICPAAGLGRAVDAGICAGSPPGSASRAAHGLAIDANLNDGVRPVRGD